MATTNKTLNEGVQLGIAASVLYTAPANTQTVIKKLTVTNTSAGAVNLTLYLVVSGGGPTAANTVTSAKAIAAGATYEAYEAENHVLSAGDTLQGLASVATSLSVKASGIEVV